MDKKKRILIVEDEESMHKSLKEYLEERYAVSDAFDGEEAVAKARKDKPDLILLDIILPKKDGYEVLDELKDDPETERIPVILLTNLESPEDIQKAFEKGAMTYLVKSVYKLEDVAARVRETLGE